MKKFNLFICILLLAALLAGCSSTGTTEETEDSDDEISLEVWVFFDENTPGTYYIDLWEELAEEYGYDITVKQYSTELIKDKLKIALACDELPDIFAVWGGTYPDYLFDAGACLAIQDYLDESGLDFKDTYVQTYTDGNNYIFPCLVEAYGVTYANQDLMDLMGLTMPETWDELLDLVDTVNEYNEENGTDYAAIEMGEKDSWLGELLYDTIVNSIDPYAFDELELGNLDFSDDVFTDAADKLLELVDSGAFEDDYMETGEKEAMENFINGEAVLFPHQSTINSYLVDSMGEDAFTVESFPCCADEFDPDYTQYVIDINDTLTPGLCVSAESEYADEAAELCMEFTEEVNELNVTEYGYLNILETSDLELPDTISEPMQQLQELIDNMQKTTPLWYALMDQDDGKEWRSLTKKLMANAISIDDFISDSEDYLNFTENVLN